MEINDLSSAQIQNVCTNLAGKASCGIAILDLKGVVISSSNQTQIGMQSLECAKTVDLNSKTITLPLLLKDRQIGTLEITSSEEKTEEYIAIIHASVQSMLELIDVQHKQIETEHRFDDFSDIATEWFWEMGPEFRFTYISQHVQDVMGLHPDQIIGKTRQDIYGHMEIFGSPQWKWYLQCIQNKKPFTNFDLPWCRPDGTDCFISLSGKPRFDHNGNFLGYRGVGRDITERERLKFIGRYRTEVLERLAKGHPLKEILTLVISASEKMNNGMLGSILLLDKTGKFLVHGTAPSLPNNFIEAIDGVAIGPSVGSCGTAAFTREQVIVDDIETSPFWTDYVDLARSANLKACWSQPIFGSNDEVLGTFAMYYTEPRKPTQAELDFIQETANIAGIAIERSNALNDLAQHRDHLQDLIYEKTIGLKEAIRIAEDANKAKSEFLSGMSHELRTPLNAILGFAQILELDRKDPLVERQIKQVQQIRKGGEHLLELINEILDLAKIEAGKIAFAIETINAQELIEDCFSFSSTLANKQGIALENRCQTSLPSILTDPLRAKQALLNLLSNAVKYNRANGKVWLEAHTIKGNLLRISVHDTGIGIAPEKQKDLFVPFQRLGAETTEIEGTGIGLSLTKRIVEEMNASVGFISNLETGSHFWIDFPIKTTKTKTEKNLLLYIESSKSSTLLMNGILENLPQWTMVSAQSARLGLSLAEEQQPTLIILDTQLPDMKSAELIQRLKMSHLTKNIPILALIDSGVDGSVLHAPTTGIQSVLTKPLNIPQLEKALKDTLDIL